MAFEFLCKNVGYDLAYNISNINLEYKMPTFTRDFERTMVQLRHGFTTSCHSCDKRTFTQWDLNECLNYMRYTNNHIFGYANKHSNIYNYNSYICYACKDRSSKFIRSMMSENELPQFAN